MIKIDFNNSMLSTLIVNNVFDENKNLLSSDLIELLEEGFIQFRGSTFYNFVADNLTVEGNVFEDVIGVEADNNKIYLDEDTEGLEYKDAIKVGLCYSIELMKRLELMDGKFEIIFGIDQDSKSMHSRFYSFDEKNSFGSNDLDKYDTECILRIITS